MSNRDPFWEDFYRAIGAEPGEQESLDEQTSQCAGGGSTCCDLFRYKDIIAIADSRAINPMRVMYSFPFSSPGPIYFCPGCGRPLRPKESENGA